MPVKRRVVKQRPVGWDEVPGAAIATLLEEPAPNPSDGPEAHAEAWAQLTWRTLGRSAWDQPHPTLREVWQALEDELLAAWVEARPRTRPRAWWAWSAPGAKEDASFYMASVPRDEDQAEFLAARGLLLPQEQRRDALTRY